MAFHVVSADQFASASIGLLACGPSEARQVRRLQSSRICAAVVSKKEHQLQPVDVLFDIVTDSLGLVDRVAVADQDDLLGCLVHKPPQEQHERL